MADLMIAVEPDAAQGEHFDAAGGAGKPRVGQLPVCFDRDAAPAKTRAHEQFRWFGGGWKVNAELLGTGVLRRRHDVRPRGGRSRVDPLRCRRGRGRRGLYAVAAAGFTDLALVQIGGKHQGLFLDWAEQELLPELRDRLG